MAGLVRQAAALVAVSAALTLVGVTMLPAGMTGLPALRLPTTSPSAPPPPAAASPPDAAPSATPPAPVTDATAVPYLNEPGRAAYRMWLNLNVPRAFAIAPNGRYGWQTGGRTTPEALRTQALDQCAMNGTKGCTLYAENLNVAWPGRIWSPPPAPGPLLAGPGYAFVPDNRFIWHGPQAARGVYVWGHGYAGPRVDARGSQPQPHLRPFNTAGFDVVRFDRDPRTDERDQAARWLRAGLEALRAQGYRTVIVGGQSRGGWNALQMLDTPGLADVIVAVSPAAHGEGNIGRMTTQINELRGILDKMPPSRTRVAVVQFEDDGFAADPEWRADMIQINQLRLGGTLLIDRPDGFRGHFAGSTDLFSLAFGPCLLRFALGEAPGLPHRRALTCTGRAWRCSPPRSPCPPGLPRRSRRTAPSSAAPTPSPSSRLPT